MKNTESRNAFESGDRKMIPAVLVYLRVQPDDLDAHRELLMLHRNSKERPGDYHAGKWNGLGGKLEADESAREAAVREVYEESGILLEPRDLKPLGMLHFPNFKAHKNEDWLVTVWVGDLPRSVKERSLRCPEGELHWIAESRVMELNLWAGDQEFMPWVLRREPFQGTIWYQGQAVLKAELFGFGGPLG